MTAEHAQTLPTRDTLYDLYERVDAAHVRALREFVDLFPPMDSRVALERWEEAREELRAHLDRIRSQYPGHGDLLGTLASTTTRDEAFTALDLYDKYRRGVNVLVLDVDETLRSAGLTDNEIPRETLHAITRFHEAGVPVVICTGQTLENVKGFAVQGLGSEVLHSGDVSIVYEAGTGVFTPGHGPETKQLLYERLGRDVRDLFGTLRARMLPDAPDAVRRGCHLQGNEFNVTVKPNYETGSDRARDLVAAALVHQLDLLGELLVERGVADVDPAAASDWVRAFYAAEDPEIRGVLADRDCVPACDREDVPGTVAELLDRIDVAHYEADAAEVTSRELDKAVGVRAAFDVLGIEDPFALVMGDSKSDLRVMRFVANRDAGVAAAPAHASRAVLDHVESRDGLVFDPGRAHRPLRTLYAMTLFARADGSAATDDARSETDTPADADDASLS